MRRTFLDDEMLEWEAYVSGGQPGEAESARIYFVCLTDPFKRPRWIPEGSGDVALAHRRLRERTDEELSRLLTEATPLD